MAERRPDLDMLIRSVSSEMRPITLDEVKARAERSEFEIDRVVIEPSTDDGGPPLDLDEVIELARHRARSGEHDRRRPTWVVGAAAAVAVIVGCVAVVGVVRSRQAADRISSAGPGFEVSTEDSTGTPTSRTTVDTTTVGAPADDQPPSVVSLDVGFDVLALLVLDGGRLAVAGQSDTLQYWDPDVPDAGPTEIGLEPSFTVPGQPRSVASLGRLPSGGLVVASSFADSLVLEEIDPGSGAGLRGTQLTGSVEPPTRFTVLRNGDLAYGGASGLVRIEPVGDDGTMINTAHSGTVLTVVELGDGRMVSGGNEGTIRIWDRATGVEDGQSPATVGHSGAVLALTVLVDGRVASGDENGAIRIWDPNQADGAEAFLDGHTGAVNALVELPDGRLASGGDDGTIRIWDPSRPAQEPELLDGHTAAVYALAVLPDGRLASGSGDATVRIWNINGTGSTSSDTASEVTSDVTSDDPTTSVVPSSDVPAEVDIPVLIADRAPTVIQCETGPPDFPPNDVDADLEPTVFATPEEALDDVLASISGEGMGWKELLVRVDTPDGSINYAAPVDNVLPVGSRPVEEALLLVVVRPSSTGEGFVPVSWERVGC